MINIASIPTKQVLVAIDIAKSRHEVLIAFPNKKRRKKMSILSNKKDYDRLVSYLQSLDASVSIGFEPTGNYHRTLVHYLYRAGFELWSCPGIVPLLKPHILRTRRI
ncbi:MAG: transposase [Rhizobiales bacterium]|nr:transposase [Hyphomicrobiales bacterium]